jgi:hypothetical protein
MSEYERGRERERQDSKDLCCRQKSLLGSLLPDSRTLSKTRENHERGRKRERQKDGKKEGTKDGRNQKSSPRRRFYN